VLQLYVICQSHFINKSSLLKNFTDHLLLSHIEVFSYPSLLLVNSLRIFLFFFWQIFNCKFCTNTNKLFLLICLILLRLCRWLYLRLYLLWDLISNWYHNVVKLSIITTNRLSKEDWVCKSPCFFCLYILLWNLIFIFICKILAYFGLYAWTTLVFPLYVVINLVIPQSFIADIFALIFYNWIIILRNSK
jgi:hypothetical protein